MTRKNNSAMSNANNDKNINSDISGSSSMNGGVSLLFNSKN